VGVSARFCRKVSERDRASEQNGLLNKPAAGRGVELSPAMPETAIWSTSQLRRNLRAGRCCSDQSGEDRPPPVLTEAVAGRSGGGEAEHHEHEQSDHDQFQQPACDNIRSAPTPAKVSRETPQTIRSAGYRWQPAQGSIQTPPTPA
jgi:hypothetical protein